MQMVMKRSPFISGEARFSFSEMLQNVATIRAAIDSSRDLLDGIVRRLQTDAANRTSEIARVLTVLSAIVLPLTLISGIYGMNFQHMPELAIPWAYPLTWLVMLGIAGTMLIYFWRKKWL
jgi:magnesium transporter